MVASPLALARAARPAEVYGDWLSGDHYQEVFGAYTYLGAGVRGFGTTTAGAPTDGYGRIVYIDTHNSVYGAGWRRESAIVSHGAAGVFCHGFVPMNPYAGLRPPAEHAQPEARARRRRPVPHHRHRAGRHAGLAVAGPRLHKYNPRRFRRCAAGAGDEREAGLDSRRRSQVRRSLTLV